MSIRPNTRALLAFSHDVAATLVVWITAFWLRFNLEVPQAFIGPMWQSAAWVVVLHGALFWGFGLYRGVWRYASLPDLKRILIALLVAAIATPALLLMLRIPIPRSVLILQPILLLVVMGGSRTAYRMWKEGRFVGPGTALREPVFVIGGEQATVTLLRDLESSRQWRVAGVFDRSAARHGRELHGVKVLGGLGDLGLWRDRLGVALAIIAMPSSAHGQRREAVEACRTAGLAVMTVPSYDDLVGGKVTVSQIRHVELDDLLGRDPVVLDSAGLSEWIEGRVVLVTGAGGSIGSEICRQVLRFAPQRMVLLEASELALYAIEQELAERGLGPGIACVIGDVRNRSRITQVLADFRPSVVFHAAAYKHVPLMEDINAGEAVANNAGGTYTLARACIEAGVEKFVLISTDKAVNPTSVMGASKRLAEMVCQALQQRTGTRFVMVRFGNVLGSTGSVIPKFRSQIARGGPVTVTHPEIRRYFMSIPEAVQLVLQAGLMGKGGEIFVLDMGEPVRIVDLARELIRLSGFTEDEIRIVYTGLRPGEKLFEELLADDENTLPTPHARLRVARARPADAARLEEVSRWLDHTGVRDADAARQMLARWIAEYTPSPHGQAGQDAR